MIPQKAKRWTKPSKPRKKVVTTQVGKFSHTRKDFYCVEYTSYGGFNHKNRDRKGGHNYSRKDCWYKYRPLRSEHTLIEEGYQDYLDEISDGSEDQYDNREYLEFLYEEEQVLEHAKHQKLMDELDDECWGEYWDDYADYCDPFHSDDF